MVSKISPQQLVSTSRYEGVHRENIQKIFSNGNERPEHEQLQNIKNEKMNEPEVLQEVVEAMNDFLNPVYTSLKFELHEKLNKYYVQVIDQNTKEIIREIPPKKLLDVYAAIAEYIGLIVDEKI